MRPLALAYAQKQEYDRAIGVLNRYAAISPTNSFAYHTRGDVYIMADRYDDAIASYTRASAIEPTFIEHKRRSRASASGASSTTTPCAGTTAPWPTPPRLARKRTSSGTARTGRTGWGGSATRKFRSALARSC